MVQNCAKPICFAAFCSFTAGGLIVTGAALDANRVLLALPYVRGQIILAPALESKLPVLPPLNSLPTWSNAMSTPKNAQPANASTTPEFTNILMATDFSVASQAALQEAIRLSHKCGARLIVLHVFEYSSLGTPDHGMEFTNVEA